MYKKNSVIKKHIFVALTIIFCSCAPINTTTPFYPIAKITATIQDHITPSPVATNANQKTESTPSSQFIPICSGNGNFIPQSEKFSFSGTLLYQKSDFLGLYTITGEPPHVTQILVNEKQKLIVLGFSPDRKWLAYLPLTDVNGKKVNIEKPNLVLLSAADWEKTNHILDTTVFLDELPLEHKFDGFSRNSFWINNNLIYITLTSRPIATNTSNLASLLPKVVNPFEGTWDLDLVAQLPNRFNSVEFGISPDLTRALFEDKDGLVLKDLSGSGNILSYHNIISPYGPLIRWSPNSAAAVYSQRFVRSDSQGTLLINRDGMIKPIFTANWPLPETLILETSWSHDSRFLALLIEHNETLEIFIYDALSDQYISQCPLPVRFGDLMPGLIWSPDNTNITYSARGSSILVLNIASGKLIELVKDAMAVGWSDNVPVVRP